MPKVTCTICKKEYYKRVHELDTWLGKCKECYTCPEAMSRAATIHGLSAHPLYSKWHNIKGRVRGSTNREKEKRLYSLRGIDIDKDWENNFVSFYEWAIKNNWTPGLDIDRIDNNAGYHPHNCRFVDRRTNLLNRNNTGHYLTKFNIAQVLKSIIVFNKYLAGGKKLRKGSWDKIEAETKLRRDYITQIVSGKRWKWVYNNHVAIIQDPEKMLPPNVFDKYGKLIKLLSDQLSIKK